MVADLKSNVSCTGFGNSEDKTNSPDELDVVYFHLFPAAILWHAEAAINVFTHMERFGYRNFDTADHSKNSHILGWLIAGEGYHNNHHWRPQDYNFSKVIESCKEIKRRDQNTWINDIILNTYIELYKIPGAKNGLSRVRHADADR